jgi:RimJ/RimL family protein N-acetyltransferase
MKILLREPLLEAEPKFLAAVQQSVSLHSPWVQPPSNSAEFASYYQRYQQDNHKSFWLCDEFNNILGVFNISEILRGPLQSAYLGFYAMMPYVGKGYMSLGLKLVLTQVFTQLQLHRIEANVQPTNANSIRLVSQNGFIKEGFSPRYLKINGIWCDHERWAVTQEDWQPMTATS